MQKNHQHQKIGNDIIHERKELIWIRYTYISNLRCQKTGLAERLEIVEIPERRDHSWGIPKSAYKLYSNPRITSELCICVGDSKEPSRKHQEITRRLKKPRRNLNCSSLQGDKVWHVSPTKFNCELEEKSKQNKTLQEEDNRF